MGIQCQKFGNLIVILWKKFVKKFCDSLKEHTKNIIVFEKQNVTVNKRRTQIISGGKSMLYLRKGILEKFDKDKNYRKFREVQLCR